MVDSSGENSSPAQSLLPRRWPRNSERRRRPAQRTAEKKLRSVQHIFLNEVLPHCGMRDTPRVWRKKAAFLGMCVRRLVSVSRGHERADDRDHNANKRLDGPGPLLAVLFRQLFRNHLKSFKASLEKFVDSGKQCEITDHINFRKITSQLAYHFATGNWSVQSKTVNTGVVQILSRMSAQAALSLLRWFGMGRKSSQKAKAAASVNYQRPWC